MGGTLYGTEDGLCGGENAVSHDQTDSKHSNQFQHHVRKLAVFDKVSHSAVRGPHLVALIASHSDAADGPRILACNVAL
jgi:hypothetical protein